MLTLDIFKVHVALIGVLTYHLGTINEIYIHIHIIYSMSFTIEFHIGVFYSPGIDVA